MFVNLKFFIYWRREQSLDLGLVDFGEDGLLPERFSAPLGDSCPDALAVIGPRDQLPGEPVLKAQRIGEAQRLAALHLRERNLKRGR